MTRVRSLPLALLAAVLYVSMTPAAASAVNAYGQTFAGQDKCLSCHGNIDGRWQVGTYTETAHGRFVTDVRADRAAQVPATTGKLWPTPIFQGGLGVGAADVWLQIGAPGSDHEYVSPFTNTGTHTLSTGASISSVTGPADDTLMYSPLTFGTSDGTWEVGGATGVKTYFQGCGGCHFLGITRATDTTYTLGNGALVGHSTETSYSGFGIQCESCHGTGRPGNGHWNTGVEIVRTKRALKSQTCGQCHVNGTAKEKNYAGKTFSSPNGFTPDRDLADFFNVYGTQYVRTSPSSPAVSIPATDTKIYPDGHNKGMHHGYYNEWMLSGHARSLRYKDGSMWTSHGRDECLRCHSGEAFLKSVGYGADGPNDIGVLPSSIASDTLNVECGVCHTVHARTGDPLGLRLPEGKLCESCHTARIQSQEATPGSHPRYDAKEMIAGNGLIGVAHPAKRFMGDAQCSDCHMPVTYERRVSHRFTPMMPGDAEAWNVQAGDDSCTPCHPSRSRSSLQADIDAWQADITAGLGEATAALAAAKSRPESATPAGKLLCDSAQTNVWFVQADGSGGVHDHPYAKAGLDKAAYFARAVGSRIASFGVTAFDTRAGLSMAYGTLVLGDGSKPAGELVTIEALPGGTSAWTKVATVRTTEGGTFTAAVGPSVTTRYRAVWTPLDSRTAFTSAEDVVTFGSTTTARLSASASAPGRAVTLSGSVSPAHAGCRVTVQYHYGSYSWHTLATPTLDKGSAFSTIWKAGSRGIWYFRVVFPGDATHAGSTSAVLKLQVK